ncbi:AMP-binding enzyme [Neobacillus mesonae]|uniref:AMP-binding enzyme n=1 Tax=Neobacillus mesonae TaxID=1193713 RepID=UPI00082DC86E|nr:hypothetical protein [Neobacillus mesonae]
MAAFIVPKLHASLNEEVLKDYCSQKLGRYKIPKRFIFVKELPKTHVGKIDKKKLKEMHCKV